MALQAPRRIFTPKHHSTDHILNGVPSLLRSELVQMLRRDTLPEAEIYETLANDRRRETIRQLTTTPSDDTISLRELSEIVAARETGESPPPRSIRESVYNSLHQTHLPKLEELGVVRYDRDAREIRVRQRARTLDLYMEVVTVRGFSWSEIYRTLGVVALTLVVATRTNVPFLEIIDPLIVATVFLCVFVVVISYQLWSNRWYVARALRE